MEQHYARAEAIRLANSILGADKKRRAIKLAVGTIDEHLVSTLSYLTLW